MRTAAALMVIIATPLAAAAQERQPDSLYVSGQLDAGNPAGAAGAVELVRTLSDRSAVIVGGASASVADAWWSYGRVGGFTRRGKLAVLGTADTGIGTQRGGRFPYLKYVGALTVPAAKHVYIEVEGQSVFATHAAAQGLKVGGVYFGLDRVTLRTAVHQSWMKSAEWRYVSGRADVDLGRLAIAAGITTGAKTPSQLGVLEWLARSSRDIFGAVTITTGRVQTTWAYEVMRAGSSDVHRVLGTLRIPMGSRPPAGPGESR
jgi:hypothetical protein